MNMKNNYFRLFLLSSMLLIGQSCQDELSKVSTQNVPTFDALNGEIGLEALAKGGIFVNGFGGSYNSINDGLGTGFQLLVYGMHEAMGDVIYVPWGNNNFKFLDNPTDITLDDGTVKLMPIGTNQPAEVKLRNDRAYGSSNPMLVEWTYMYVMNNACNILLSKVDKTTFSGDATTKKNTIKAWAYFWKGYAYSRIGSMYIAGLILDEPYKTTGSYVTNTEMIAAAKTNFDKATALLTTGISNAGDYGSVLGAMIPDYCLKNGVPTTAAFIRNINTMLARNILVSKRVKDMAVADWNSILTLTANGVKSDDGTFVIKTTQNLSTSIIDPNFGEVASLAATNDPTFFISEKLIQDFRAGDKRLDNNFDLLPSAQVNRRGRGLNFGTRYFLVDGGKNIPDAISYCSTSNYGVDDKYMVGSYEENQLMRAEASIQTGDISGGTGLIDEIRTLQGAGLATIGAISKAQALEEIRSERRIALLFRGLAFYDARRLGIIDDKSKGGGRAGAVVLSEKTGGGYIVNTNAFINYNYLSYFDVPKNELEFNAPTSGSAVVVSPN
jgi:starch-binding outer membrane protein, SusD/RagB family